jgi:hypothetical protein
MKKILIATLIGVQCIAATAPAAAATLEDDPNARRNAFGSFGGARLRLSLDGPDRRASAGLALAPVRRSEGESGSARVQFGEGLAFGSVNGAKPRLSLAGRPVGKPARRAWQDDQEEEEKDGGISPIAIGAIVLGVVAIGAFAGLVAVANENSD